MLPSNLLWSKQTSRSGCIPVLFQIQAHRHTNRACQEAAARAHHQKTKQNSKKCLLPLLGHFTTVHRQRNLPTKQDRNDLPSANNKLPHQTHRLLLLYNLVSLIRRHDYQIRRQHDKQRFPHRSVSTQKGCFHSDICSLFYGCLSVCEHTAVNLPIYRVDQAAERPKLRAPLQSIHAIFHENSSLHHLLHPVHQGNDNSVRAFIYLRAVFGFQ